MKLLIQQRIWRLVWRKACDFNCHIVKAYETILFTQGHMRMGFVKTWTEKKTLQFQFVFIIIQSWASLVNHSIQKCTHRANNEHRKTTHPQPGKHHNGHLVTFVLSMLADCQNTRPLFGQIRYNTLLCVCAFKFLVFLLCFVFGLFLFIDCFVYCFVLFLLYVWFVLHIVVFGSFIPFKRGKWATKNINWSMFHLNIKLLSK